MCCVCTGHTELLGELQLSFVTFLIGHGMSACMMSVRVYVRTSVCVELLDTSTSETLPTLVWQ